MHRASSLTSQITIALSLLAAIAVTVLVGVILIAASKADQGALRRQRILVQNGLTALIASLPREQESVSVWDEAVLNTAANDQAWMAGSLGDWMFRFFGHDRTYVLDNRDRLVFASRDGNPLDPPAYAGEEELVKELVAGVRGQLTARRDGEGRQLEVPRFSIAASNVCDIGHRPALIGARPILPHSDHLTVSAGSEYMLVSVRFIEGPVLEEIAHPSLAAGLHYVSAEQFTPPLANTPVTCQDGRRIGYFVWEAHQPGIKLVAHVAPWAGFALAVAFGVGLYQARHLRRTSIELQVSEGRARHLAYHDVLTGLPNRALFEEKLDTVLKVVRRQKTEAALLFLDLDRFKSVNDTLGHRAGDQLMCQAAARLQEIVGEAGMVARVGGDEFAIIIVDEHALDAAKRLSGRIIAALASAFHIGDDVVHIGASIGVATAPAAGLCRYELLRKADIALYEAKRQGRGRYQIFSEKMDDIVKQRRMVEADLRTALTRRDELEMVYQPLYSAEEELIGAEALLRWRHPVHSAISTQFLITIAEEAGLIMQLGDWTLHQACEMVRKVAVPWIAVNVSPAQLRDRNFAGRCLDILAQHKVPLHRIQIEVTEAIVIDAPELAGATLHTLRAAGIRIALDDFGTGYCSMSYLKKYPFDRLKIDRVFTRGITEGEEGRAIVAAMIEMAHALKLKVAAEGVETAEQRDALVGMDCDEMQGYLFSRPLSGEAFAERFYPGARANSA